MLVRSWLNQNFPKPPKNVNFFATAATKTQSSSSEHILDLERHNLRFLTFTLFRDEREAGGANKVMLMCFVMRWSSPALSSTQMGSLPRDQIKHAEHATLQTKGRLSKARCPRALALKPPPHERNVAEPTVDEVKLRHFNPNKKQEEEPGSQGTGG